MGDISRTCVFDFVLLYVCWAMLLPIQANKLDVTLVVWGSNSVTCRGKKVTMGPMADGVYEVAVEELNRRYGEIMNISLVISVARGCLSLVLNTTDVLAQQHYEYQRSVTVFSTAGECGCGDKDFLVVTSWFKFWNQISIFTVGGQDYSPNLPTQLSLASVCTPCFPILGITLIEYYNWNDIFVLVDLNSAPANLQLGKDIANFIKERVAVVRRQYTLRIINSSPSNWSMVETLTDFRDTSRVMFFHGHASKLRDLLITAYKMNMTNGDYVYIAAETVLNFGPYGIMSWQYNDSDNLIAKDAFNSLLIMQPVTTRTRTNDWREYLATAFQQRSAEDGVSYEKNQGLSHVFYGIYDSVMVIGQVLYEAFVNGDDVFDGQSVVQKYMINRTFTTDLDEFYVDPYGARKDDVGIAHYNTETNQREMFLVQNKTSLGTIHPVSNGTVNNWPGGKSFPPPSRPRCGFKNNDFSCRVSTRRSNPLVQEVTSSFVILIIGVALVVFRVQQIRYRQFLNTWWIMAQQDLREAASLQLSIWERVGV